MPEPGTGLLGIGLFQMQDTPSCTKDKINQQEFKKYYPLTKIALIIWLAIWGFSLRRRVLYANHCSP